jgi:hypothetical protein
VDFLEMIDVRIDANDTRLKLQLDNLPKALRRRLRARIEILTNQLLRMVEAREPVRTGYLRSRTRAYVDENPVKNFVRGRVRILATGSAQRVGAAFGALEYGSTGRPFPVRPYTRNGHTVRGYQRRGTIQAQRFLRGPAAIMLPKARRELQLVLRETVRDEILK